MRTCKTLLMLSLIVLVSFGCMDDQDDDFKKGEKRYNFTRAPSEGDELFPTYSPGKNGEISNEIIEAEHELKARLDKMAPIPLPETKAQLTTVQKDRILKTYRRFLQDHERGALMIRHFRNRYAKVILQDYDVINSDDYALIAFLTKELIDSKCGRFKLIFDGLNKVKGHVADNQYNLLVGAFENQVAESLNLHKYAKAAMPGLIQKMKDKPETVRGELRADFVTELYEIDDLSPRIKKLEKYLLEVQSR